MNIREQLALPSSRDITIGFAPFAGRIRILSAEAGVTGEGLPKIQCEVEIVAPNTFTGADGNEYTPLGEKRKIHFSLTRPNRGNQLNGFAAAMAKTIDERMQVFGLEDGQSWLDVNPSVFVGMEAPCVFKASPYNPKEKLTPEEVLAGKQPDFLKDEKGNRVTHYGIDIDSFVALK